MAVERERQHRTPLIFQSFNYAFEGLIHVLRRERNMRIHFAIATAVLVLAFLSDIGRFELIALMIAIAFVLIAEMVNTAVEATIDLATTSFDPLGKLAKDIAAGAVLIASANAVVVGYLVFAESLKDPTTRLVMRPELQIRAESLFTVVDSAALDAAGQWAVAHRDTVRAWRLDDTSRELTAWVDAEGRLVASQLGDLPR